MSRQSKASDVYSFGILLWELFTGGKPFEDVKLALMGHEIAVMGKRPPFPPYAPQGYVKLTEKCWAPEPGNRPSFNEILDELLVLCAAAGPTTTPLNVVPPKPIGGDKESGWSKLTSSAANQTPALSSPFRLPAMLPPHGQESAAASSTPSFVLLQTPVESVVQ